MRVGAVMLGAFAAATLATAAGAGAVEDAVALVASQTPADGERMVADALRAYGCSFDESTSDDFAAFATAQAAREMGIDPEPAAVQEALVDFLGDGFDVLVEVERVSFGVGTGIVALKDCP